MDYRADYNDPFVVSAREYIKTIDMKALLAEMKASGTVCSPWNKGLVGVLTLSKETREKLRQANIGKTLSQEHKNKIGLANSISRKGIEPWNKGKSLPKTERDKMKRYYQVKHPDGNVEIIHGLDDFCQKYGLQKSGLSRVLNGKKPQYKGFKRA